MVKLSFDLALTRNFQPIAIIPSILRLFIMQTWHVSTPPAIDPAQNACGPMRPL